MLNLYFGIPQIPAKSPVRVLQIKLNRNSLMSCCRRPRDLPMSSSQSAMHLSVKCKFSGLNFVKEFRRKSAKTGKELAKIGKELANNWMPPELVRSPIVDSGETLPLSRWLLLCQASPAACHRRKLIGNSRETLTCNGHCLGCGRGPLYMGKMGSICHFPRALSASTWGDCSQNLVFAGIWGTQKEV